MLRVKAKRAACWKAREPRHLRHPRHSVQAQSGTREVMTNNELQTSPHPRPAPPAGIREEHVRADNLRTRTFIHRQHGSRSTRAEMPTRAAICRNRPPASGRGPAHSHRGDTSPVSVYTREPTPAEREMQSARGRFYESNLDGSGLLGLREVPGQNSGARRPGGRGAMACASPQWDLHNAAADAVLAQLGTVSRSAPRNADRAPRRGRTCCPHLAGSRSGWSRAAEDPLDYVRVGRDLSWGRGFASARRGGAGPRRRNARRLPVRDEVGLLQAVPGRDRAAAADGRRSRRASRPASPPRLLNTTAKKSWCATSTPIRRRGVDPRLRLGHLLEPDALGRPATLADSDRGGSGRGRPTNLSAAAPSTRAPAWPPRRPRRASFSAPPRAAARRCSCSPAGAPPTSTRRPPAPLPELERALRRRAATPARARRCRGWRRR